jgi:hypothetical protein
MSNATYNGWTNYATWRVNLEAFDGLSLNDLMVIEDDQELDLHSVAETLKAYAEGIIDLDNMPSTAKDWAMAFIQDVDFRSIARHMLADYVEAKSA